MDTFKLILFVLFIIFIINIFDTNDNSKNNIESSRATNYNKTVENGKSISLENNNKNSIDELFSNNIVKKEYKNNNCDIKGNISFTTGEKIYHLPGCKNYNDTIINEKYGEKWFCSEKDALYEGWRKAYNCN